MVISLCRFLVSLLCVSLCSCIYYIYIYIYIHIHMYIYIYMLFDYSCAWLFFSLLAETPGSISGRTPLLFGYLSLSLYTCVYIYIYIYIYIHTYYTHIIYVHMPGSISGRTPGAAPRGPADSGS